MSRMRLRTRRATVPPPHALPQVLPLCMAPAAAPGNAERQARRRACRDNRVKRIGESREDSMILIKHFTDAPEADDGVRMWIEPIELVPEICTWCRVDHCLTHLG